MPVGGQKYTVDVQQLGQQIDEPKRDDDVVRRLINKLAKQAQNAKIIQVQEGQKRDTGAADGVVRTEQVALGSSFGVGEGLASLAPDAQRALSKLAGDPRVAGLPLAVQAELAKLFAKNPQLGQMALASFAAQMSTPGADKAFNTPLLQGEAMLVTIGLLAQPGGDKKLKDLEAAVKKFAAAYGTTAANERTKLMMFREVIKTNSPEAKAALDAAQLIDSGGAQESIVDIVRSAAKDPSKAQEKLGSLAKLLTDPKVSGAKDGGAMAKALTDFVGKSDGGRSALVELENFVDQSKMGNLSAAKIRSFAATAGLVGGDGQRQVAGTFDAPKAGGVDIKGLLRKRAERAGDTEKLPLGLSGVRPKAFAPIMPFDPDAEPEARDQQYQAQYATLQQRFHEREKFIIANTKTIKRLSLKEIESAQKEIAASTSFDAITQGTETPQALVDATGCDARLAEQIFKWDAELKDQRAKFSKEASMARRMARAKGNKNDMRTARPTPPPREVRIGPQLEAHVADELMSEFRQAWA